jgi:multiple sugar transport system permease protein
MSIITDDFTVIPRRLVARSSRQARKQRQKQIGPYLFMLPGLLFLAIFLGYPLVTMLCFSFSRVSIEDIFANSLPFVGFENYQTVLNDLVFQSSLGSSFLFVVVSLAFQFLFGFLFALLFKRQFPGVRLMRGLIMVAWTLPIVVSGAIFKWIFQGEAGILNGLLRGLSIISTPIHWLSDPSVALWSTIIANIWIGIPFHMALLLAGLQSISGSFYEAAKVDGANTFHCFRYITLPLMRPISLTALVLGFIYTFNVFDLIFVLTGGGPVNATEVIPMYAYQIAFEQFDLGTGSAVATLMFLMLFGVSLLYLYFIRHEEGG